MSSLPRSAAPALEAVREAVREGAADQARDILEAARRQAEEIRGASRAEAEEIRRRAGTEGREAARTEALLQSARTRRQAGGTVLSREEDLRSRLRREVLAETARLRTDPRYPRLLDALREQALGLLGPGARVEEAPDGGITGSLGSRSVDLSLPALAEAALDSHAKEVRSLWQE